MTQKINQVKNKTGTFFDGADTLGGNQLMRTPQSRSPQPVPGFQP
jgi:hypothetical protein